MKVRGNVSWGRAAGVVAVVMAGVVAGCGGTTPPPTKTENASAQVAAPAAEVTKKVSSKGRGQATSPGGDMGVRERRSQKLKERAEAGKS